MIFVINCFTYLFAYSLSFIYVYISICDNLHDLYLFLFVCIIFLIICDYLPDLFLFLIICTYL